MVKGKNKKNKGKNKSNRRHGKSRALGPSDAELDAIAEAERQARLAERGPAPKRLKKKQKAATGSIRDLDYYRSLNPTKEEVLAAVNRGMITKTPESEDWKKFHNLYQIVENGAELNVSSGIDGLTVAQLMIKKDYDERLSNMITVGNADALDAFLSTFSDPSVIANLEPHGISLIAYCSALYTVASDVNETEHADKLLETINVLTKHGALIAGRKAITIDRKGYYEARELSGMTSTSAVTTQTSSSSNLAPAPEGEMETNVTATPETSAADSADTSSESTCGAALPDSPDIDIVSVESGSLSV